MVGVGRVPVPAYEFYFPELHRSLTRTNQRYNDRVIAGLGWLIDVELAFESGLLSKNIAISIARITVVLITQFASLS
jgi:hypothetical protein